jgi:hypothetical protein
VSYAEGKRFGWTVLACAGLALSLPLLAITVCFVGNGGVCDFPLKRPPSPPPPPPGPAGTLKMMLPEAVFDGPGPSLIPDALYLDDVFSPFVRPSWWHVPAWLVIVSWVGRRRRAVAARWAGLAAVVLVYLGVGGWLAIATGDCEMNLLSLCSGLVALSGAFVVGDLADQARPIAIAEAMEREENSPLLRRLSSLQQDLEG